MATDLPPEQHASYSAIIDQILSSSDLNTISAKRIRKGLQEKVEYDITPQKAAITELIMLRFDKFQRDQDAPATAAPEPAPTTNGAPKTEKPGTDGHVKEETSESTSPASKRKASTSPDEDDDLSEVIDSPPKKKAKKSKPPAAETDEEFAKRMQAELNAPTRATRGGATTKKKSKPVVKSKKQKTPKKKSKAKINSDDDSNVENASDGSDKPAKERKGGFHKPMGLSDPLAALVGASSLSRPQTVKKIWEYVKERDLQDPSDKRQIRCDDAMRAVFKQEKVHMFTMNKLLAQNLYPIDAEE